MIFEENAANFVFFWQILVELNETLWNLGRIQMYK